MISPCVRAPRGDVVTNILVVEPRFRYDGTMKNRRRPTPTGKGTQVQVRLNPELLSVLDHFIAEQQPVMTRPEALRYAFRDWAVGQGLLSPQQSGCMTDDQITASADEVRSRAGDAADIAMAGMDATKEQKATRRRELTDEAAFIGKARAKGKKSPSVRGKGPEKAD